MAARAVVWGLTLVPLVVLLALAGLQIARALRELKRVSHRVDQYSELPLVAALRRAGNDAQRLQAAAAEIEPLVARAQRAVAVIRSGPIPPDVVAGIVRIGVEIQALAEFSP